MAFPVVEATNTGVNGTNATTHSINLPSGVTTGDLLLVVFSADGAGNLHTGTTGWTKLAQAQGATEVTGSVWWKIATGSDALTITTSASEQTSHVSFRISGASYVSAASYSSIGAPSEGSKTQTHYPPGGADDYLWIAALTKDSTRAGGITDWTSVYAQAGASGASTSTSYKTENAASMSPGQFSTTAAEGYCTWTIAIHPTAPSSTGVKDHFGDGTVKTEWEIRGDETGVTRTESNGKYSIALPSGTLKQYESEPKLIQYVGWSKQAFTITARFENNISNASATPGDRIIVYVNDRHFIALGRRWDGTNFRINAIRIVNNGASSLADAIEASAGTGPVWLRITRASNGAWSFFYSFDGSSYTQLGGTTYTYNQIDPLYIGISSYTAATDYPAHTTEVEWFSTDADEPEDDATSTDQFSASVAGSSTVACTARVRQRFSGAIAGTSTVAGVGSDANVNTGFSDHFNDGSLDSRWTEQDSVGGGTVSESGGELTVSLPSGTSYDNPGEVKVWQTVDNTDLIAVAKLTHDWSSATAWQQAGILIAQDNNNYIVLKYQKSGSAVYRLLWGSISGGGWSQINELFGQSTDYTPLYIKLTKTGTSYRAYYSSDGSSWTESSYGAYTRSMTVSKMGMTTGSWESPAVTAKFDWFSADGNEPSTSTTDQFSGAITGSSTVACSMDVRRRASGAVVGSSIVASSIRVRRRTAGAVAGSSVVAASVDVKRRTSGAISGSSAVASSSQVHRRFSGSANGTSTVAATVTVSASQQFTGSVSGSSVVSASAQVRRRIVGAISGSSVVSASFYIKRRTSGSTTGSSLVAASMDVKRRFSGAINGSSSVDALFNANIKRFAGSVSTSSFVSADAHVMLRFIGQADGSSLVEVEFSVPEPQIKRFTGFISGGSAVRAYVRDLVADSVIPVIRELEITEYLRKVHIPDKIRHVLCDMSRRDLVPTTKIRVIYFSYDKPSTPVDLGIFDFTFDPSFE